jgi:pullulanase/glycogen debranching enzyme
VPCGATSLCLPCLWRNSAWMSRACASYPSLRATWLICTGDEYAATRGGNNNWYGHDTAMTRFDWDELDAQRSTFFRFYRCRERHVYLLKRGASVAPRNRLSVCSRTDH